METRVLFLADRTWMRMGGVAVGLEVVEVLRPEGLGVCPPGGEDPGMGSGFGEVFGNLEGCRG